MGDPYVEMSGSPARGQAAPAVAAIQGIRRELLSQIDTAAARQDVKALKKLYREIRTLAESVGVGRRANRSPCYVAPESSETVIRHAAGPGLPGWGRRRGVSTRRVGWSGPAREHAPLQYPYGEPPTGWDTRRHDATTTMPESKLSPVNLARIQAFRREQAEIRAAEDHACERHGHVRYRGANESVEYDWPDDSM